MELHARPSDRKMPTQPVIAALLCATVLGSAGCERPAEDAAVSEPIPDTMPLTGSGSELPEAMPVPATPDTLPR